MKLNKENSRRLKQISRSLASGRALGELLAGLAAVSIGECKGEGAHQKHVTCDNDLSEAITIDFDEPVPLGMPSRFLEQEQRNEPNEERCNFITTGLTIAPRGPQLESSDRHIAAMKEMQMAFISGCVKLQEAIKRSIERDLSETLKGATKWLIESQGENGGWESDGCGMRDTGLALMALGSTYIHINYDVQRDVQREGYLYLISRLEAAGMSLVDAIAAESKHKDALPIVAAALSHGYRQMKNPDMKKATICAVRDLLAQCAEGRVADAESMAWAAFCLRHAYWGGLFQSAPELLSDAKSRYGQLEGAWKAMLQDEDGYFYGRAKYEEGVGWYDRKTGVWHNTSKRLQAVHEWRTAQAKKFMALQKSGSRKVGDTALGVLKLGVDVRSIEMSRTWLIDPAPFGDVQPSMGNMADLCEGDTEVKVEL